MIVTATPPPTVTLPMPPGTVQSLQPAAPQDTVAISPAALRSTLHQEVVHLTQRLVQVDSGPGNLVAGQNQVCDILQTYAQQAGLQVERFETRNGKPMLIVTLPGTVRNLEAVGFVHHSDVVGTEGDWKLGAPFSGALTKDEHGRDVLVGRGSVDTKGPAAQVLVAMKYLKQSGTPLSRTMKLFVFPDEETGGQDGAWYLSRIMPDKFRDVKYWVVEGSGILSKEMLQAAGVSAPQDVPYLAVAQKYSLPTQIKLKQPVPAAEAVGKTKDALGRLDEWIEDRAWTHLGDDDQSHESYRRLGNLVGGIKGWALRHFWYTGFMQRRMGTGIAAANRTDASKTDFYLSSNTVGSTHDPNVKPSSASVVLRVDLTGKERDKALQIMQDKAGDCVIEPVDAWHVRLRLPQEKYGGGNHGSTADREHDAVDVTLRSLTAIQKAMKRKGWGDKVTVADIYTSKSTPAGAPPAQAVTSIVTLDLRVAIDDDRTAVLSEIQNVLGTDFELSPIYGAEELDARVRRLRSDSELFQAAEKHLRDVHGADAPILMGNTTATNDCRFLMDINPQSETLTFVPLLYTEHGAHAPDECVTIDSLHSGTDWCIGLMQQLGKRDIRS